MLQQAKTFWTRFGPDYAKSVWGLSFSVPTQQRAQNKIKTQLSWLSVEELECTAQNPERNPYRPMFVSY